MRTSAGDRWTFPKGHVEDETLPQAALREAREEAGTDGTIDERQLADFPYPPHPNSERADDLNVAAYLLEVTREGLGGEPGRSPTWFSPADARRALADGREPENAEAMAAVLDAAVERLG